MPAKRKTTCAGSAGTSNTGTESYSRQGGKQAAHTGRRKDYGSGPRLGLCVGRGGFRVIFGAEGTPSRRKRFRIVGRKRS